MLHDPLYLKGIDCFNRRDFFEAHEVWENLWNRESGAAHQFVQGLIQFATALYHFQARNLKGARILYDGGVELLRPYEPLFWELPVRKLIEDMTACFSKLLNYRPADLPGRYHPDKDRFPLKLEEALIPKIELLKTGQACQ